MTTAIVLAGGLGKRLRECVSDVPKPMAPVAGRPFLEIVLDSLQRQGFKSVVLSIGFLGNLIREHFGDRWDGMEIIYSEELEPLGTGGAIREAMRSHVAADSVCVLNGDTYVEIDRLAIEQAWEPWVDILVVAKPVDDVGRYGSLVVREQRLVGFDEKGRAGPGLINAGFYKVRRQALESMPDLLSFSFESDWLAPGIAGGTLAAKVLPTDGKFIDIGVPSDFKRAQAIFQ